MFRRLLRAAAPFLLAFAAAPAAAQPDEPITAEQLMRHIEVLASDAFEGRGPGTEGERRTIAYISEQFAARGFEPAGPDGSWYQPVAATERRPGTHRVRWSARGRRVRFDGGDIVLVGKDTSERLVDAPVVFVGHGAVDRERGIDQLAGADLRGAVALILVQGPDIPDFPGFAARRRAVIEAGVSALIAVIGAEIPWPAIVQVAAAGETALDLHPVPEITGLMSATEVARLVRASGGDFEAMLNEQPGSSFRPVPLRLRVSLDVETNVRRIATNNVVGRLRGTGGGRESVMLLGHWDHLGLCRPEGAEDRICNGAVDNASGIATMIEAAGRLSRGPRQERDILVLATTIEEAGLLGAHHFAARPVVPLDTIAAAVNVDTVAINDRGELVAVIGRGTPALDEAIAATATALGRTMDTTHGADAFLQRQDGWALMQAGVPTVMVGGSFANMPALQAFLAGPYHGPEDEIGPGMRLEGAAEDADLLVALLRRLATPALYQRPPGWRAPRRPSM